MRKEELLAEVEVTHIRGSGPGGQHRNKRMTGIRLVHRETGLMVEATERRSQWQNLGAALERMARRLAAHRYVPPARHKTKRTKGSVERRLSQKKRDSRLKRNRRSKPEGD